MEPRILRRLRIDERKKFAVDRFDAACGFANSEPSDSVRWSAELPFVPPDLNLLRYRQNRRSA
jgi:hypothetical protein